MSTAPEDADRDAPGANPRAGMHLCCLYETDDAHAAVLVPFLRAGLAGNDMVVCIVDAPTAEAVTGGLRDGGMDPAPYLASGQLVVAVIDGSEARDRVFASDRPTAALHATMETARAGGYAALTLAVQTSCALEGPGDPPQLERFEVLLNELLDGTSASLLCTYDRRRFGPAVLLEVLRTHPTVAVGTEAHTNPHFVPPAAFHGRSREAIQLDAWLRGLAKSVAAEDEVRAVRLRLERALEGTGAGTWEHNIQTGTSRVDARWAAIVGYTLDEIGSGFGAWRRLTHPEDLGRADEMARRHQAGELPMYEVTVRMRHKQGHWVWVLARGRVLERSSDGRPLLMFGTHVDVTEWQRGEDELRTVHARLQRLFDANIIGIAISGAEGRVIEANDYYLDVVGYSRDELRRGEVDWRAVTAPEWEAADEIALRQITERGVSAAFEKEYRHRDGRRVPVLLASAAIPGSHDELASFVLDISRRKAAEEAIREGEERYRQLFDSASDAVFVIDPATMRIVDANAMASILYGYDPEELIGRPSPELSAEPERTASFLREARTTPVRTSFIQQRLHRRKDGTVFPVEFSGRTVERGGATLLLVSCRDITDRRAAEEAIHQMALVLDSAPTAITVYDVGGQCLYANPKAIELHGYSRDEFMALRLGQVTAARDSALVASRMQDLRERGEAAFEAEHVHRDGSTFPLAVTARYTTWSGREAILAIDVDITKRRAAERALLESKAELEEAQRVAHVGNWTWDPVTDVAEWSDELFRILGREPGGPVPGFAQQRGLHAPETDARLREAIEQTLRTGESYEIEYEAVRDNGSVRHLVERGEAIRSADGCIARLRGTLIDVTELSEARARVDQAERAEMVGRLAGGVAHDFNNLLTAIGGYAELLDGSIAADDPRHEDVAAIRSAAWRGASLTRQLLAFGRRDTLKPTITSPADVVDGLTPMLRSLVPADIALVVHHEPGVRSVRVDRDHLEHALLNLVLNARDAMPGGGTLTVETDSVVIEGGDPRLRPPANPGAYVRLSVTDTGTGIPADQLPHIFEPFFTTKVFGQGSGLGLSSVDGFVAQSGGLLTVETKAGEGSTFCIHLAQVPGTPAPAPRDVHPVVTAGAETILLVDDEPSVRAVTGRLLRELGYVVLEAGDPAEALLLSNAAARIDLLVTDVVMPGMNGSDLARRCAAQHPGLPTLLISGYVIEPERDTEDRVGELPLLAKPYTAEALAARVRILLDGRMAIATQSAAGDPRSG